MHFLLEFALLQEVVPLHGQGHGQQPGGLVAGVTPVPGLLEGCPRLPHTTHLPQERRPGRQAIKSAHAKQGELMDSPYSRTEVPPQARGKPCGTVLSQPRHGPYHELYILSSTQDWKGTAASQAAPLSPTYPQKREALEVVGTLSLGLQLDQRIRQRYRVVTPLTLWGTQQLHLACKQRGIPLKRRIRNREQPPNERTSVRPSNPLG